VAAPRYTKYFTNFKRAKWGLWIEETEAGFAAALEPASCSEGEQIFRKILLKASGHLIPAGFRKDFVPGMPREAVELTKEHDRLQELDPLDPGIQLLNLRISECVTIEARKLWQEEVETSKPRHKPDKFLRLRNISGISPQINPSILAQHAFLSHRQSQIASVSSTKMSLLTKPTLKLVESIGS
jgi:hypothetical protein